MRRPTRTPTTDAVGRCRVKLTLTPEEAAEITRAADGMTVSEFARWSTLRAARDLNRRVAKSSDPG